MKLSITTMTLAAALMALPASGSAQTPQQPPPAQPQPPATQPSATKEPATPPASQQPAGSRSAAEHLAKAKAALNEIQTTSVTAKARTRLNELKRHVAALDRAAATGPEAPGSAARTKSPARSWATDVAAIDRILTELTTPTASAGDPAATAGTTGTTGTPGRATGQAAIAIDDAIRAKLLEVRTHITAFAAAMSGTDTPSSSAAGARPAMDPAATATPSTTEPPTTRPPTTEPPPTTQPPATQPPPTTQPPTTQPPATQPTTPTDPSAAAAAKADADSARRHLTEARDVLSQLTQLPEAAQLSGDARTQVADLITNFNELITTQTEWRASFAKVQANLTALVGAERTDEANVPPPASGTAGAVGTSGMTTLDPKVRDKLIEFRAKLAAFQKAAGGDEIKK